MIADTKPQRRRVFLWSAAFGYSNLAFTLARNVLLVPLYLHYIDLGEYGSWLATGGALAQLLVADLGLSGVITQRIAAQAGRQDAAAMRVLISAGVVNALALALVLGAASSLLGAWLPATQGLDAAQRARVFDCYFIAIAANSASIVATAMLAALRGAQRPVLAGSVNLLADVASVGVTLACLFAGLGLYGIAWGLLARSLVNLAGALLSFATLRRETRGDWRPRWADSLAMWRDSGRFFMTSIAMRLQSQANTLFVGTLLGPQAAAVYGLTVRAHEMVQIFMGQLNFAFGPVLAHLAGAGQVERLNGVIRGLLPLVAALATVGGVGVLVLNQSFVTLWAGSAAWGGFALTAVMCAAQWITSMAFIGYEALLARGEFSFIARIFAVGCVLHLVVLLLALKLLGVWAAPLSLIASSLCWGTLAWRRVAHEMHASGATLRAPFGEAAIIAIAGVGSGLALLALLPQATTWSLLVGEVVLTALVVASVLLVARPALRRVLREEFMSTLRSMRAA